MSFMNTTFAISIAILFICHVSAVSINRIWYLFVLVFCIIETYPTFIIVLSLLSALLSIQQDLLQGQKVYYKDPRTRIENRRYEIPMHMQRKANLHQQKAILEHDTIEDNLKSIKLNAAATSLTRDGRTINNFICNDDTEMSDAGYKCKNMDQISFVSNAELGTEGSEKCGFDYINDIWGWTSPVTQKQYALVGMWDGTSFVDITDPSNPLVLGFLETAGDFDKDDCGSNFWRDVKVVSDFAYVGAEVDDHGIQSFNLKRLDLLERPLVTPEPLTRGDIPRLKADSHIDSIGNSHNLISFEEMDQLLVVGFDKSDACSRKGETVAVISSGEVECLNLGGLINEGNKQPFAMGNSYAGYVHDGQCFIYNGPDLKYKNIPICIFFAETEIGIYDMKNRKMISTFSYDGATYVHQGWVSTDHTTLYANDENDEECRSGELDQCRDLEDDYAYPMTRIFDISSLENIGTPREFVNTNVHSSIDHNMYVQGDYLYSANYEAGARIYKILEDKSLEEVAYFDVSNDCEDILNCEDPYGGVWTHYPFKRSTTTIASNGFYGLHILKTRLPFEPVSLDSLFD